MATTVANTTRSVAIVCVRDRVAQCAAGTGALGNWSRAENATHATELAPSLIYSERNEQNDASQARGTNLHQLRVAL